MADILKCEPLLAKYGGFRKLFRFPYLAEGRTAEGRDAMRALLKANGYRNAHVTIDTSDWYIDNRLKARLETDPQADLSPYRRFYLDHLWERATYYDGLAKTLFGHSLNHTILLHHRLTTGLFLGDALQMFKARGWRLIDADAAFRSPEFTLEPTALPAGQSLLWALSKTNAQLAGRLRFPGEDGEYEAGKMDALNCRLLIQPSHQILRSSRRYQNRSVKLPFYRHGFLRGLTYQKPASEGFSLHR